MPVLDARALDHDPEGMALLADVLRPATRARRRKAVGRWTFGDQEPPPIGRELVEDEPEQQQGSPALTLPISVRAGAAATSR